MKVSSCYTVYGFDDINIALKIYRDLYGCRIVHHPEIPDNEYYVVEDASGNRTDLVSGRYAKSGFHAVRINVDDIAEAVKDFTNNGATSVRGIFDYPACKVAVMNAKGNGIIIYKYRA